MGANRKSLTQAIEKVAEEIYLEKEKEKQSEKKNTDKLKSKENTTSQ